MSRSRTNQRTVRSSTSGSTAYAKAARTSSSGTMKRRDKRIGQRGDSGSHLGLREPRRVESRGQPPHDVHQRIRSGVERFDWEAYVLIDTIGAGSVPPHQRHLDSAKHGEIAVRIADADKDAG